MLPKDKRMVLNKEQNVPTVDPPITTGLLLSGYMDHTAVVAKTNAASGKPRSTGLNPSAHCSA